MIGCPVQNCHFTLDPSYLSSPSDFDMVLFLAKWHFEKFYENIKDTRTEEQIYAVLLTEPPHLIPNLSFLDNAINWTISYRLDADINWPYGYFIDRTTKERVAPDFHPKWRQYDPGNVHQGSFLNQTRIRKIVAGKQKSAAWFVSNCNYTTSERSKLVKEMQKYIPVDIYGRCGNLTCKARDECLKMLEKDYKFYLSFENSLCDDYITEKATRQMEEAFVIPVLYNGAEVNRMLPPHSYIDVRDFESVKELTAHLVRLGDNLEEYLSYFWWKEHYEVNPNKSFCSICQKLNSRDQRRPIPAHPDLENWYRKDRCRKPNIVS